PKDLIFSILMLCVSAVAAVMWWQSAASGLEALSFITGAACVWLTVKENAWNFPISLLNVSTFCFVFFQSRLFADASLQVVYFILTLVGWYLWLYGGTHRTALRVARASRHESSLVLLSVAAMTLLFWSTLRYIGGSASFWDALTTAICLGAQWLLNRKRLENWILWIVADCIYVPLYLYKQLYLTSLLYAVFLVMAGIGLAQWRATWRRQGRASDETPVPQEAAA
ncbi:MAG TPA: nicotinamide riboside transporter PnuC, partial [Phycisphaerae bacterium]|nr:nicotinamide riboside transporter PnuC [Phycisphaerae bacterium]